MTATPTGDALVLVVASPLEREHVERIAAVDPGRLRVVYEADLLSVPEYVGDHHGTPPELDESGLARWRSLVADADILFDFDWCQPETLPERAPRLRWIQATSSGIGGFLARTELNRSSIVFTTAAGIHAVPLAEFVLLCLLYFAKDIPILNARKPERHWERHTSAELSGQRILVVGLGRVGGEIARRCAANGIEVWGMRRDASRPTPEGVSRLVSRADLRDSLPEVQGLVLACAHTPETHHLIGHEELKLLPGDAVLVNVARGEILDEPALIDALQEGRLRGAGLDVFETEPLPADSPLWDAPNVLISPHSASTVDAENSRIVDIFVENLRRYLDGRPLLNVFDSSRGY